MKSGYGLAFTPSTPGRSTSGLSPNWTPHNGAGALPPSAPRTPSPSPNGNGNGFSMEPRRSVPISYGNDIRDAENGLEKDIYDD
jgi:hypothetical protein